MLCKPHQPKRLCCRGWRRRGGRGSAAASPTEGIACPHGKLLPQAAGAKARRIAVPPLVWHHLLAAARQGAGAEPALQNGCTARPRSCMVR